MADFTHEFEATIEQLDAGGESSPGRLFYSVVWLPERLNADLPLKQHPRLRVDAEVDGRPHHGAFMPVRGRWYLLLSKKTLAAIRRSDGDRVHVRFRVADQEAVDVPAELRHALEADALAQAAWEASTAGRRRGLAYRVASAKRAETRERRVEEVLDELR
ncbi:MAG: YdeI/OmpD-associated family protein [Planctomycetota bacterium]